MAEKKLELRKKTYGSVSAENLMDSSFEEFGSDTVNRDIDLMFQIYEDAFFDIEKNVGEKSHLSLINRSQEYINDFIDPRDVEIEDLNELYEVQDFINHTYQLKEKDELDDNDIDDLLGGTGIERE